MFNKKQILEVLENRIEEETKNYNRRVNEQQRRINEFNLDVKTNRRDIKTNFKKLEKSIEAEDNNEIQKYAKAILHNAYAVSLNPPAPLTTPSSLKSLQVLFQSIKESDRESYSITAMKDLGLLQYVRRRTY